ncbi:MAG: hypothetical protein H8E32_15810 [Nitrospinae bacterium]|nr:hypothetical protein [Nitrospinota bacterium]
MSSNLNEEINSLKRDLREIKEENAALKLQLNIVRERIDVAISTDTTSNLQALRDLLVILTESKTLEQITARLNGKLTRVEVASCINRVGGCPLCNGFQEYQGKPCPSCINYNENQTELMVAVLLEAPILLKEVLYGQSSKYK